MSTCLGKMTIDGDKELGPQFKKMKLSSEGNGYDIMRANLVGMDLQKELKNVFPYLSEEKIKDILEKSENNSEAAKKMIREINNEECKTNRDFVNLHQQNRKRRFNEMMADSQPGSQMLSQSNNVSSNTSNNLGSFPERRKFQFRSHQNAHPSLSEEDLEKIIAKLEHVKSRDEAKEFLKKLVPDLLKLSPMSKSTHSLGVTNFTSSIKPSQEESKPIEEMKKINETLIHDNQELKKCVLTLYRKTQADQKIKDENRNLQTKLEKLEEELMQEKSKNQSMVMILRQYEQSSRNNVFDNEDIY